MWESIDKTRQDSAHYSVMRICKNADGMEALRAMFPDGEANSLNVVLFSTSGVHGTYNTIEEAEATINGTAKVGEECLEVTFLIIHPRLVSLRYGVCNPESIEDIEYLKKLRKSSHEYLSAIGVHE